MMLRLARGPVETPRWLAGKRACPVMIRGEAWWQVEGMIVKGFPPDGVAVSHSFFHSTPEDFGPVGAPRQVSPRQRDVWGGVTLLDMMGEQVTKCEWRVLKYLLALAQAPAFIFHYAEVVEGESQPLCIFRKQLVAPQMIGLLSNMLGGEGVEIELTEQPLELFAMMSQMGHSIKYFLPPEEIAAMPRYGGTKMEGHHD